VDFRLPLYAAKAIESMPEARLSTPKPPGRDRIADLPPTGAARRTCPPQPHDPARFAVCLTQVKYFPGAQEHGRSGDPTLPYVLAWVGYPGLLPVTLLFVWRFLASMAARVNEPAVDSTGAVATAGSY